MTQLKPVRTTPVIFAAARKKKKVKELPGIILPLRGENLCIQEERKGMRWKDILDEYLHPWIRPCLKPECKSIHFFAKTRRGQIFPNLQQEPDWVPYLPHPFPGDPKTY
jgi:hypothetical protein